MSQVIVTKDLLRDKREKTRAEEKHIDKSSLARHWSRSNIEKTTTAERIIGLMFLPILGIWALLTFFIAAIVYLASICFKGFSFLFGKIGAAYPPK